VEGNESPELTASERPIVKRQARRIMLQSLGIAVVVAVALYAL